jgi:hypothetical protein
MNVVNIIGMAGWVVIYVAMYLVYRMAEWSLTDALADFFGRAGW